MCFSHVLLMHYTTYMVELFAFLSLMLLFFFSQKLTSTLAQLVFHLTKKFTISIQFLSILFLPGVIIHELSHWFMANMLFVQTGDIEFFPQKQGDKVKLGSVQIAKTDFFRRFLIGIAPFLGGIGLLSLLYFYLSPTIMPFTYKSIIFLFTLFEIGNTMYASKKDMEGALGMVIFLVLVFLGLLFLRVPLVGLLIAFFSLPEVISLSWQIGFFCSVALFLDMLLVFVLSAFLRRRVL